VLGVLLLMLWLRSGWTTRCAALLVGALAVRCHLKPAEVERIIAIAGGGVAAATAAQALGTALILQSPAAEDV
jgi:hypothetical protein